LIFELALSKLYSHGTKCPTHKRDLAHATEFNHFCKEKPAEQPENTGVPAAGQLAQA
jgi:hypothetical protein